MGKVKFYTSTREKFDQLGIKDNDGIYFITDTHELYKGENKIAGDFQIPIATGSAIGGIRVAGTVDMNWVQEHYPDLNIPGINLYTLSDGSDAGKIFLHVDTDVFTDIDGVFSLKTATNHNMGGVVSSSDFSSLSNAQVNTMVSPDGIIVGTIKDGSISSEKLAGDVIPKNLSDFNNDLNYQTLEQITTAINNAVASTYKVKGSTTRAELPKNAVIGDVWNLTDEDGQNVVWTGANGWDNLGSTVELTWDAIQGKPTEFEAIPHRHDNVTSAADGFMSKEDKIKLDGIAQYANNYILPVSNSTTLGGVKLKSGTSTNYTSVNINNAQFAYVDYATPTSAGTVKPGNYMSVTADGTMDCNIPWNEL